MMPYILNWRNPWDGEAGFYKEDPAPHQVFFYNQAIEELAEDLGYDVEENELIPDGGRPRKYFWAWRDENGNYISDTTVNGDSADIAQESPEEAEEMLERLMKSNPEEKDRYRSAVCYKIKIEEKEMEGVEVETVQSGLTDYAPDGGFEIAEEYYQSLSKLAESAEQVEW